MNPCSESQTHDMCPLDFPACEKPVVDEVCQAIRQPRFSRINGVKNTLIFHDARHWHPDFMYENHEPFLKKGYYLFMTSGYKNENEIQGCLGLVRTSDKYDIIRLLETHGKRTTTDNIVEWLRNFEASHRLILNNISKETLHGHFEPLIENPMAFALEIQKICPDMTRNHNALLAVADHVRDYNGSLYLTW